MQIYPQKEKFTIKKENITKVFNTNNRKCLYLRSFMKILIKNKKETVISKQIIRSGTSIGANIREAHYAHGTADFIAKLQIALKESQYKNYPRFHCLQG